jgi:N-acetylneuraminic acid mutarotase
MLRFFKSRYTWLCLGFALPGFPLSYSQAQQLEWQLRTPAPTARLDAAVVATDDYVYYMGGDRGVERIPTDDGTILEPIPLDGAVARYKPRANTWETTLPAMPVPLTAADGVRIGEHVYLPGGIQAGNTVYNRVQAFNETTGTWSVSQVDAPNGRRTYAAVALNDLI